MMSRMKELEEENRRLKKMYLKEKLKAEIVSEAIELEPGPHPSVAIGGSLLHHIGYGLFDMHVISSWWRLSAVRPIR